MKRKIKLEIYTDESGQDTNGKLFVVCSVVLNQDNREMIEKALIQAENKSRKYKKWHDSSNRKKKSYIEKLLGGTHPLKGLKIFYSEYQNKKDYLSLIAAHIVRAIFAQVKKNEDYAVKVFIDKTNNADIAFIKKEIKKYGIRYKKIRGLTEESSSFIRLADACCGVLRRKNKKSYPCFLELIEKKFQEI